MHPLLGYLFIYHPSLHPSCWQPAGPTPADEEICERRKRKIDCSKIGHNQYPRHLQTFQSQLYLLPASNENLLCFRNDPSKIHQPGKTRSHPFSFRLCCMAGGVISVMALSWLSSSRGKVIMGLWGRKVKVWLSIGLASVLRSGVTDLPLTVETSLDPNQRCNYSIRDTSWACEVSLQKHEDKVYNFQPGSWTLHNHYISQHILNMALNTSAINKTKVDLSKRGQNPFSLSLRIKQAVHFCYYAAI